MSENHIKILITGDLCPINRIERLALGQDYETIFNDFIDVFKGNDLNVADLECPFTFSNTARLKTGPHQKVNPDCIEILTYADIRLAAMANNHMLDYGSNGVGDTLKLCRKFGIKTCGVGRTAKEASEPFILNLKNKKIAFLNYADYEFLDVPDQLFQCNPVDPVSCSYEIENAREQNDYVIVIIHSGNEFYELPSPRIKKLYRFLADQGADVIISHHTHAWTGYEIYNSKLIFYGLGNFLYDWPGKTSSRWNEGYAVRLDISEKVDFEIIPLKQCTEKPGVFRLTEKETETFQKEMNRLNIIIGDDKKLEGKFQEYCNSVFPMYDSFIEPNFGRYIAALRKRGLFPRLLSGRKRLLLLNLTRCESHRDVLLRLLKQSEF